MTPEEHRERMCGRKKEYSSEKDALQRIKSKAKRGYIISDNIRIYKCPYCGWYHVGHSKRTN